MQGMHRESSLCRWVLLAFLSCIASAAPSAACDIPVFRFAMAYWEADDYEVAVFHRGELPAEAAKAVASLGEKAERSNIEFEVFDLSADGGQERRPHADDATLPWMEISFPNARGLGSPIWAGVITPEAVDAWTDSPARAAVVRGLLDGNAAVWLLVRSGDSRSDEAAERTLRSELARLERVLLLPGAAAPGDVSFAVIAIDADDRAEKALLRMLIMTEPDLAEMTGRPMAFPVYGRARVLHALVGPGINAHTIADSAEFVVGPCSCQVKALNPGTDMLVAADWAAEITPSDWAIEPELGGIAGFASRMEEAERLLAQPAPPPQTSVGPPIPAQPPAEPRSEDERPPAALIVFAAFAGLIAVTSFIRLLHRMRPR